MDVAVSNRVVLRDNFGRFMAEVEAAGPHTVRALVEEGAQISRALAPKGGRADPRTIHLADSIRAHATGTRGYWEATARHALPVETGSRQHFQTGQASFYWMREGRMWNRGSNQIDHPAVAAHPYMRPAYEIVMSRWIDTARRFYPRG